MNNELKIRKNYRQKIKKHAGELAHYVWEYLMIVIGKRKNNK